jgi:hypothetical protein
MLLEARFIVTEEKANLTSEAELHTQMHSTSTVICKFNQSLSRTNTGLQYSNSKSKAVPVQTKHHAMNNTIDTLWINFK